MASNIKYNLGVRPKDLKFASCINNGMGIGSLCSAIIGGVIVLGYIFESKVTPEHSQINHIRMEFIDEINVKLRGLNCSQICKLPIAKENCISVVAIVSETLQNIIEKYI